MKTKVLEIKKHQQREGVKTIHTVTKIVGEVAEHPGETPDPMNRHPIEVYKGESQFDADNAENTAIAEMYA